MSKVLWFAVILGLVLGLAAHDPRFLDIGYAKLGR
jgi:hypothetical protein